MQESSTMNNIFSRRSPFLRGLRDGIPIAAGYLAVGFTLGIAARNAGMSVLQSGAMSAVMVASAGQFAAMGVIASGTGYLQMFITTLIVNARYLLMSCALSQKVPEDCPMGHRLGISYLITDEIFGIAMNYEGRLDPRYNYGAGAIAVPGWVIGSMLGTAAGAVLPPIVTNALGVALYGMFLAIIIPPSRRDHRVAAVVAISMALSFVMAKAPFVRDIPSGTTVIILTIVISAIAALICPVGDRAGDAGEVTHE